jgi:hypothetical protein
MERKTRVMEIEYSIDRQTHPDYLSGLYDQDLIVWWSGYHCQHDTDPFPKTKVRQDVKDKTNSKLQEGGDGGNTHSYEGKTEIYLPIQLPMLAHHNLSHNTLILSKLFSPSSHTLVQSLSTRKQRGLCEGLQASHFLGDFPLHSFGK